jgi:hypothetical protein
MAIVCCPALSDNGILPTISTMLRRRFILLMFAPLIDSFPARRRKHKMIGTEVSFRRLEGEGAAEKIQFSINQKYSIN